MSKTFSETNNLKIGIKRVLKQVHPDIKISLTALEATNSLLIGFLRRLSFTALALVEHTGKTTVGPNEVQASVNILLDGLDIAKHAIQELSKAVTRVTSNPGRKEQVGSGLQMSLARIENHIRRILPSGYRVSGGTRTAATAVVEYLCAEIMELAGNQATDAKRITVMPEDIARAIMADKELSHIFSGVLVSGIAPIDRHPRIVDAESGASSHLPNATMKNFVKETIGKQGLAGEKAKIGALGKPVNRKGKDYSIESLAVNMLRNYCSQLLHDIGRSAVHIARNSRRSTLQSGDVELSIQLLDMAQNHTSICNDSGCNIPPKCGVTRTAKCTFFTPSSVRSELKSVAQDMRMSPEAVTVAHIYMESLLTELIGKAAELMKSSKKVTLSAENVKMALKL